jgi:hypothetical protein
MDPFPCPWQFCTPTPLILLAATFSFPVFSFTASTASGSSSSSEQQAQGAQLLPSATMAPSSLALAPCRRAVRLLIPSPFFFLCLALPLLHGIQSRELGAPMCRPHLLPPMAGPLPLCSAPLPTTAPSVRRPAVALRSTAAPSPPQCRPSSSPHSQRRGHSSPWRPSPSPNQRPPCSPGRSCPFPCRCFTTRTTCMTECPIYAHPFFLLSHGVARRALHFLDAGKKNRRSSPPVHSPLPRRESSLSRLLRSEQHVGMPAGCLLFLRSPVVVVVHPGETATLLVRFRINIIFL